MKRFVYVFLSILAVWVFSSLVFGQGITDRVSLVWDRSFDTYLFDTFDGTLGFDHYAVIGGEYVYEDDVFRDLVHVTRDELPLSRRFVANVVGEAFFSVFRGLDGRGVKVRISSDEYFFRSTVPGVGPARLYVEKVTPFLNAGADISLVGSSSSKCSDCSTITFANTFATTTDPGTFLGFSVQGDSSGSTTVVKYDGASTTLAKSIGQSTIWYESNFSFGTKNVSVTRTGGVSGHSIVAGVVNLSGVDVASPVHSSAVASAFVSGGTVSTSLTSSKDGVFILSSFVIKEDSGNACSGVVLATSSPLWSYRVGANRIFGGAGDKLDPDLAVFRFRWSLSSQCIDTYYHTLVSFAPGVFVTGEPRFLSEDDIWYYFVTCGLLVIVLIILGFMIKKIYGGSFYHDGDEW